MISYLEANIIEENKEDILNKLDEVIKTHIDACQYTLNNLQFMIHEQSFVKESSASETETDKIINVLKNAQEAIINLKYSLQMGGKKYGKKSQIFLTNQVSTPEVARVTKFFAIKAMRENINLAQDETLLFTIAAVLEKIEFGYQAYLSALSKIWYSEKVEFIEHTINYVADNYKNIKKLTNSLLKNIIDNLYPAIASLRNHVSVTGLLKLVSLKFFFKEICASINETLGDNNTLTIAYTNGQQIIESNMIDEIKESKKRLQNAFKIYQDGIKWNSVILSKMQELWLQEKNVYTNLVDNFAQQHNLSVETIDSIVSKNIFHPVWLLKLTTGLDKDDTMISQLMIELLNIKDYEIFDIAFNRNNSHMQKIDAHYKFAKEIANDLIDMRPYFLKDDSMVNQVEYFSFLAKIYSFGCLLQDRLQIYLVNKDIEFAKEELEAFWPILNNLFKITEAFMQTNTNEKFLAEDTVLCKMLRSVRHEIKPAIDVVESLLANFQQTNSI